jgi:hypothetical protein
MKLMTAMHSLIEQLSTDKEIGLKLYKTYEVVSLQKELEGSPG